MYFAYLDLTTIDELSNEMKSPHNVFALLVIPWLFGLRNSSIVVTVDILSVFATKPAQGYP